MRQTLKLATLFSVLFCFVFFSSCEEDNISYDAPKQFGPKQTGPASYLTGSDAEDAKQLLNGVMDNSMNKSWSLDFSEILLVKDSLGNKNFTFRVVHPNSTSKEFYNLVLTENLVTRFYSVKLVRYVMSQNFADRFHAGTAAAHEFSGTITFTPVGDRQPLLPIVQPGEDPTPNPEPEPDPCEDEIVITVPGGGGGGSVGGGGSGGGGSGGGGGGGGNGGPIPDNTMTFTDCYEWIYIQCSKSNEHYGNSSQCNADFPGATYLVNTCNNTVNNLYGRNVIVRDPCAPVGNIGVLFPLLVVDCNTSGEVFNNYYSHKSPFNIDLSLVRPECADGTVDPAKEKFMCVYNKLIQSPTFKNLFTDLFGGTQEVLNVKFDVAEELFGADGGALNGLCYFTPTAAGANVTIVISKKILIPGDVNQYVSSISIAKTILHECIHAYLGVKGLNENLGMTIPGLNNTDVGELIDEYVANYPFLQADHNFMYNHMIPTMVQCLSEIRDLLATPQDIASVEETFIAIPNVTNPTSVVPMNWNDFFKYLAFRGLDKSEGFQEGVNDVPSELSLYNQYHSMNYLYFPKNCVN